MIQDQNKTWNRLLETKTRSPQQTAELKTVALVPGLTILCHPDPRRVGERSALVELSSGREMTLSRREPVFAAPGSSIRRPLVDPFLSRRPIRLAPSADEGLRLDVRESGTAVAVDGVPLSTSREISTADLDRGVVLLLAERIVLLLHRLLAAPPRDLPRWDLVGESPALLQLCQEIGRVADLDVPVLMRGETGTGKELTARAIHQAGERRSKPFLAINMGAVSSSLASAELFGAARGAYTGATGKRAGYFERASGGTLFLDEIGETPLEVQALLLRTLESGEIQTVGGDRPRRVDVRLLTATDADLEAAVQAGIFRTALLHRLRGFEIRLPPLRQRRDDVGRLFFHFAAQELAKIGEQDRLDDPGPEGLPWLPAPLMARLAQADWPGNVRQLRNFARYLVIASRGQPQVNVDANVERLLTEARGQLPSSPEVARVEATPGTAAPNAPYRRTEEVSEDELLTVLARHRWRLQPTAVELGVSRTALYGMLKRFPSIRKPKDLGREEIERCRDRCQGDIEAMVDELRVSRKGLRRRMTQLGIP